MAARRKERRFGNMPTTRNIGLAVAAAAVLLAVVGDLRAAPPESLTVGGAIAPAPDGMSPTNVAWRVFPIADTTLSATGTVGALSDDLRRVGTEKLCHLSTLYMSELVQMWGGIERVDGILSWGKAGSASAGVRVSGTAPGVQPAAVQIVQLGRPMPISTPALFLCPYPPHSDGPNGAGASLSLFPPYCESSGSKSSAKSSSSRPRYWTVR